jgi:hypothetical protein
MAAMLAVATSAGRAALAVPLGRLDAHTSTLPALVMARTWSSPEASWMMLPPLAAAAGTCTAGWFTTNAPHHTAEPAARADAPASGAPPPVPFVSASAQEVWKTRRKLRMAIYG